jgi:hypothetical protein
MYFGTAIRSSLQRKKDSREPAIEPESSTGQSHIPSSMLKGPTALAARTFISMPVGGCGRFISPIGPIAILTDMTAEIIARYEIPLVKGSISSDPEKGGADSEMRVLHEGNPGQIEDPRNARLVNICALAQESSGELAQLANDLWKTGLDSFAREVRPVFPQPIYRIGA